MRGVAIRQTRPGTRPARAQVPQLMVVPRASLARSTASGLAAMAVINMAEEIVDVWNHVFIRYAPSFFSVPFACAHNESGLSGAPSCLCPSCCVLMHCSKKTTYSLCDAIAHVR